MSASPTVSELLEALPFPALIIGAQHSVTAANAAAQSFASRLKTLPEMLRTAVSRAIDQDRATRFAGEEIPPMLAPARQVWITPFDGKALLIIDPASGAGDYTALSSTMAAMLAHEIRNPLLSIRGAAQLLGANANKNDAPLAKLITDEVARIEQLIATLDPLAPAPAQPKESLNVHELLDHAQRATSAALPQAVAFEQFYDPSLPEISGNRDALVQALVNLIKNACEATELVAMPHIILSTRYVGETKRNAAGQRLPIAISVTDNGRGVPPAFIPHLFAPFSTTKTSGRGLGLAITARIAEEHGGLVTHEIPDEGGARFTLYLPIGSGTASSA